MSAWLCGRRVKQQNLEKLIKHQPPLPNEDERVDSKDLQKLRACLSAARVFEDLINWIVAAPPDGLGFESPEDCRTLSRLRSAWKQQRRQ